MRLDKYLAHAGGYSRSDARRLIKRGEVSVDGEVVRDAARRIGSQEVAIGGRVLALSGPHYYMLNKPAGYVCTRDDAHHPDIFSLLSDRDTPQLHAAGRLDADTTGLVLLSDDGAWTHRVSSPKRKSGKRYRVALAETLDSGQLDSLRRGVELRSEAKPTLPAEAALIDEVTLLLTLYEGRYHQVKRMLAAVGNRVVALHREAVGGLELDVALAPGEFRPLTADEVALF